MPRRKARARPDAAARQPGRGRAVARTWLKLVCAVAFLAAPAGLTLAQPQVPQATETAPPEVFDSGQGAFVLHKASGYLFPDRLADMPRRKFRVYAPDDVQVDYTLRGG